MKAQLFIQHYREMLSSVKKALSEGIDEKALEEAFDQAKETMINLEKMTEKEAEEVLHVLKRDWHEASSQFEEVRQDMGRWVSMDVELLTDRLLDKLSLIADQTTIDQVKFNEWLAGLESQGTKDKPRHQ